MSRENLYFHISFIRHSSVAFPCGLCDFLFRFQDCSILLLYVSAILKSSFKSFILSILIKFNLG